MKKPTTTPSLSSKLFATVALVAMVFTTGPASAQSAMRQGDHEIIIQGSANIQEGLEKIQEKENAQKTKFEKIIPAFSEQLAKYNDPSFSEQERIDAHAQLMEAGAQFNQSIVDHTGDSLEVLETVDREFERIIHASRNIDRGNEAALEEMVQLGATTRALLANQAKLDQIIVDAEDGTISDESRRELQLSHNLHKGAFRHSEAMRKVLQNGKLADHMQRLRENVAKRRSHLVAMRNVAKGNLGIIRAQVSAAIGGEATRELDSILQSFTTLEDPLGLEALPMQAEIYGELIYPGNFGGSTPSASGSSSQSASRGLGVSYEGFGDLAP